MCDFHLYADEFIFAVLLDPYMQGKWPVAKTMVPGEAALAGLG